MKKPDSTIIKAIDSTHEQFQHIPKDVIYTIMVYVYKWCYEYMISTANSLIPSKPIFINGFGKFVPRIYARKKMKKIMESKQQTNSVKVNFRKVANYYT